MARKAAAAAVRRVRSRASSTCSSPPSSSEPETAAAARAPKRRKTAANGSAAASESYRRMLAANDGNITATERKPALPPTRAHDLAYHRPLLLDAKHGHQGRKIFLQWFDSVSKSRSMPWRKPWIDPQEWPDETALRSMMERRAYEVWISEIMLQQTRVAAVIDYWNKWMQKWPTVHDLARATHDDVLAAWRGLGYYSRATRIHEAAKLIVSDPGMNGLLPSSTADLISKIPGIGRYTAGAISCIAFGEPAPMVDGNVLRVLSRQLGIHGNIKTDKAVIDTIWAAADALVQAVAQDSPEGAAAPTTAGASDRPGRWGQGLMELGSTICTPKPNCAECPITQTCRAYSEGSALAKKTLHQDATSQPLVDIEDSCRLCEPFDYSNDGENQPSAPTSKKGGKQSTLAAFMFTKPPANGKNDGGLESKGKSKAEEEAIVNHARKFPVKVIKKAVREEETLVCAILRSDGQYLIHRRPSKGLLAGLWEFPSFMLDKDRKIASNERKRLARKHVDELLNINKDRDRSRHFEFLGDLGSVPWLFSHIKLTMHVFLFKMDAAIDTGPNTDEKSRWTASVESESMGTGMRKCWDLVDAAAS